MLPFCGAIQIWTVMQSFPRTMHRSLMDALSSVIAPSQCLTGLGSGP